jgi:hypothetical protein
VRRSTRKALQEEAVASWPTRSAQELRDSAAALARSEILRRYMTREEIDDVAILFRVEADLIDQGIDPGSDKYLRAAWEHVGWRPAPRPTDVKTKRSRQRQGLIPIPADVEHGRYSTYVSWGCRCPACSAAQHEYYQAKVARGLSPDDPRHGTLTGYQNWGCRCAPCRKARHYRYIRERRK